MVAAFVELTRVESDAHGTPVLVNLGAVAWIEPGEQGTSHIIFSGDVPSEREGAISRTLTVRQSIQEIAFLVGMAQPTDREAIAQAWVDQRSRRGQDDDDE